MAVKVRQRDGKWWVYIDHKGKHKAKCIGSKRAAEIVAEKIEARLALGQADVMEEETKPLLFAEYAQRWLKTHAAIHCKPATVEEYETICRLHLFPPFGAQRLSAIPREALKTLIAEKIERGFSRSRVSFIVAVIRGIFNSAVEDQHIVLNPAARLGRYLTKSPRAKEVQPLTREELRLLLTTLHDHFPAYYPFFLTLARTGIRLGEGLALKWEDLDFHGGFLDIRRNLRKRRISTPKSHKQRRVDMSTQLAETLKALLETRKEEAWQKGWNALPEWVFCSRTGNPLHGSDLLIHVLRPACVLAGLPRIRIHDLRHTYASLLIQQGESLAYVKEQLGHHSIKITVDTYGHLVPGGNRQAVDKLDEALLLPREATIRNADATIGDNAVSGVAVTVQKDYEKTRMGARGGANGISEYDQRLSRRR